MSIRDTVEWTRIRRAVREGELPVRIDGPVRRLSALGREAEARFGVEWFLGDEHGVPAYASQRSDGTSLFIPPPPSAANYTGGAALP